MMKFCVRNKKSLKVFHQNVQSQKCNLPRFWKTAQLISGVFVTDVGPRVIRDDFLVEEWLGAKLASNNSALKNVTYQKVSADWKIRFVVRMAGSRVRDVLGVVRSLELPVLLGTSFLQRSEKGLFPFKWKVVSYNSKPVQILAIEDRPDRPEEPNEKNITQHIPVPEERIRRMVRAAMHMKTPRRSGGIILVATNVCELVQIEPLLEPNSTQAWTTAPGIIDAFPKRPLNVIVLNPSNAGPSLRSIRKLP